MPGAELARSLSVAGAARLFESCEARFRIFGIGPGLKGDFFCFAPAATGDPDPEDCSISSLVLGSRDPLGLLDGVPLFRIEVESSSSGDVGFESGSGPESGEANPESIFTDDPVLGIESTLSTEDMLAWECGRRKLGGTGDVVSTLGTASLLTAVRADGESFPLGKSAWRRPAVAGLEAAMADMGPDRGRMGRESGMVEDGSC